MKQLTPEDRYTKRLELEKPVLEAFWCWLDSVNGLKESALGKAVTYAQNQKPYMENYLLDGRCALSNNAAENAIRPFTVGRKNWLFADTPKGATASAAIYSIIETAKANGLNVYTYLEFLLMWMPDTDWHNHPEDLEDLMPWSEMAQSICKA
jgi:transposase